MLFKMMFTSKQAADPGTMEEEIATNHRSMQQLTVARGLTATQSEFCGIG